MVKILLLKNTPIVTLSYSLRALTAMGEGAVITVLAHSHAAANVRSLAHVDEVIEYRAKDILLLRNLSSEERVLLKNRRFDKVVFQVNRGQRDGFENLLDIAAKTVRPGGQVLGITPQGDIVSFDFWTRNRIRLWHGMMQVASAIVFVALLAALPFLAAASALTHFFCNKGDGSE